LISRICPYYWSEVKLTAILNLKPEDAKGLHPGGTAAIGKVVNKDSQTEVDGLFACDASVPPVTPGLPPILTIVALAKRLAGVLP
jgi:choline dehydrogenase-like flavoprotein